jgi:hypothetical protein
MSKRRTEVIDPEGNTMPPPEPGTPMAQAIYLLEYGRLRGFRIGPTIQIGDVILQVSDLRQQVQVQKAQKADAPPDIEEGSDMAVLLGE